MKNIIKYILTGVAVSAAVISCDLNSFPEFDDKDSFVAFESASYQVNEDKGKIVIPVTMASLSPKNTIVTYEAVDVTAKSGVDYSLADKSATLTFDGKQWTAEIVVNISDDKNYTGNKVFKIRLIEAGTVNLGAENECTVTIVDLNHPLGDILGDYNASAYNYFDKVDETWKMQLRSDPNDVTVVWIYGIINRLYGDSLMMYGNVSEDKSTITVPLGQPVTIQGQEMILWEFNGQTVSDKGSITFTATENGYSTDQGLGVGYLTEDDKVSLVGMYSPGIEWTKL